MEVPTRYSRWAYALCVIMFASAAVIVIYKAHMLSFTHDESTSFLITKGKRPEWVDTANNHALNTLLMWLFGVLFGSGELSLRLPNALGFLLFTFAALCYFRRQENGFLSMAGMCLLLLNPFMLEYFSLARGYGISLGFETMTVYFLSQLSMGSTDSRRFLKKALWVIATAAGALLANLSTVNFYAATFAIAAFWYIRSYWKNVAATRGRSMAFQYVAAATIPLAWAGWRLLRLKLDGQLYYGAASIGETLHSLVNNAMYVREDGKSYSMAVIAVVVALPACCVALEWWKKRLSSRLMITAALLTVVLPGLIVEHLLFNTLYPLERTALYLWPLLALFAFEFLNRIISVIRNQYLRVALSAIVAMAIAVPLAWNMLRNVSKDYTLTWRYDAHTKAVAKTLQRLTNKHSGKTFTISNDWIFEPSLNYYITTMKLPFKEANRDVINRASDFVYTDSKEFDEKDFVVVDSFGTGAARLYMAARNF